MHLSEADLLSPLSQCDLVASSTPNLMMSEAGSQCGTLGRTRPHCYSNAAPQRIEGNVFRFDFSEQVNAWDIFSKIKSNCFFTFLGGRTGYQSQLEAEILGGHYQIRWECFPGAETGRRRCWNGCSSCHSRNSEKSSSDRGQNQKANHAKGKRMFRFTVTIQNIHFSLQIGTNSMRRKGGPMSLNLQNHNENVYGNTQEHGSQVRLQLKNHK